MQGYVRLGKGYVGLMYSTYAVMEILVLGNLFNLSIFGITFAR